MDSKFIKSHQCSLEKSHVVLTEINPEFCSRPGPFSTNTDSERSTSHTNLQKQNNEDFFIQLLYAWLHLNSSNFRSCFRTKDSPMFCLPNHKPSRS